MSNLEATLSAIKPLDKKMMERAAKKHDSLTKPPGSLGVLEAQGIRLAAIQETLTPRLSGKTAVVFAADHGITDEGVSAYPKVVTQQMVLNFLKGGAAINALCKTHATNLYVADMGVAAEFPDHPYLLKHKLGLGSANMLTMPALTSKQVQQALDVGIDLAHRFSEAGSNCLIGGDMGIGNTTSATLLTAVFTSAPVDKVTGRGTGLDDKGLERKTEVIKKVLAKHQPNPTEPLEVLALIGGLEIAALTGFYLGAAAKRCAIILDGFIVTAAVLVAHALKPEVSDYMFASHASQEPGHRLQLETLGLSPLFDFGMRLGEGTGAVIASSILDSACAVLSDMASFAEAGVSGKDETLD